ncbi:MAG: S-layer homology domain-containing protein [Oscillospiraceae bacterium]
MRNLKRVLSLALALVMMLGMMVIGANAASTDFADADEITYTEAVEVMAAIGVLKGDGTNFNPTDILTREQAAKIICYMLMGPATAKKLAGTDVFTDVAADRWSAPFVSYCANLGIIAGVGDNAFDPEGQLTGVAFAKMLLVALGKDPVANGYVGNNWATSVAVDAMKMGLDLDGVALAAPLTREQASQMAFTALNYTEGGAETGKYVVNAITATADPLDGEVFDSRSDAILTVNAVIPGATLGTDYTIVPQKNNAGSLAADVFGLSCNENATDDFGRAMNVWTATKVGTEDVTVTYITETPVLTYDKPVKSGELYTALGKAYDASKVTVLVNNEAEGVGLNTYATFAVTKDDTANVLGGEGQTIEIYKTATGIKAILVNSMYRTISAVDAANGTVTVLGGLTYKATGYKVGDEVLITAAFVDGAWKCTSLEKVATVTGTLTSYTNAGKYTINGKVYELSGINGTSDISTAVKAAIGVEKVYALDNAGKILSVNAPAGETPVIPTNYAMVLDKNVVVKSTAAAWPATTTTVEVSAQIQVLLSDGTVAVWDLPVAKTGTTYSVKVAGATVTLGDWATSDEATKGVFKGVLDTALDGKVFTYADTALVSEVPAFTSTETASGAAVNASGTITKTTYADGGIILNDKTVFILKDASNKIVVKTGLTALENTSISGAQIVADVTYDGKNVANNVNVAKVVFAQGTTFSGAAAVDTTNYVLLDGDYTTTKDAEGNDVYTYSIVKADGSTGTVKGSAGLSTGIYVLKTDGTVNESPVTTSEKTIGIVSGTTVYVDSTAMTTNAKTVVVGGELVKGAKAYVVETSNVISLVFIVG